MSGKHWAIIGASLVTIGAMGSSANEWSEVFKPGFVFGAIGAIGVNLAALYTQRPNEPTKPDNVIPMPLVNPRKPYGKHVN